MTKKQKQTEKLKNIFLSHLQQTKGNVLRSCELSGLPRNTALRHRKKDVAFRRDWESAVAGENLTKPYILSNDSEPQNVNFSPLASDRESLQNSIFSARSFENGTNQNAPFRTASPLENASDNASPENLTKLNHSEAVNLEKPSIYNADFRAADAEKDDAPKQAAPIAESAPLRLPVRRPLPPPQNPALVRPRPVMTLREPSNLADLACERWETNESNEKKWWE